MAEKEEIDDQKHWTRTSERMADLRAMRGKYKGMIVRKPRKNPKRKRKSKATKPCDRTRDLVTEKIRETMLEKSTYIDGVAAMPILNRIAHEMGISTTELSMFILINHLKWFTKTDSDVWGYPESRFKQHVFNLRHKGLVESFAMKNRSRYVVSLKGREVFRGFQNKYHEYMKLYTERHERENPARHFKHRLYPTKEAGSNGTAKPQ